MASLRIKSMKDVVAIKTKNVSRQLYYKESLTLKQRTQMINCCATSREKAIVSLMAYNGLRPVEVQRLLLTDVDFRKSVISIWGKGKAPAPKR
ncbi:MAG: site-specific integrase [Flammeovirgaceae bacterium]|nr:site-specific integrase [Flammeovirgaceae bacterium]